MQRGPSVSALPWGSMFPPQVHHFPTKEVIKDKKVEISKPELFEVSSIHYNKMKAKP